MPCQSAVSARRSTLPLSKRAAIFPPPCGGNMAALLHPHPSSSRRPLRVVLSAAPPATRPTTPPHIARYTPRTSRPTAPLLVIRSATPGIHSRPQTEPLLPPSGTGSVLRGQFCPKTEKPAPRRTFCIIPALFHVVLSPSILQSTPFSHENAIKRERASAIPDARSRFSIRFYLRFACPFAAMERALRSPSGAPCCGGCPRSTRGTEPFPPRSAAAP